MKILTFLLFTSLGLLAPSIFYSKKTLEKIPALSGKITDASTNEPLIGAIVLVSKFGKNIAEVGTDIKGNFKIDSLAAGEYSIEFKYPGYETLRFSTIFIKNEEETILQARLNSGAILDETIVVGRGSTRETPASETSKMRSAAAKAADALFSKPSSEPKISRTAPAEYAAAPSMRMAKSTPESSRAPLEMPDSEDKKMDKSPEKDLGSKPKTYVPDQLGAGVLTAGEWNDLNNWGKHWVDLLADGEIEAFQKKWGCTPKHRFTFLLTNKNDFPLIDATVKMFDQTGALIWETRTDNHGKAECWAAFFDEKMPESIVAQVILRGKNIDLGHPISFEKGINQHTLDFNCSAPKNVDIVFAVDATGSMGDEISYLQAELVDVLGRAQSANPEILLRTGSVFYRDVTDEYLVKSSGLTSDVHKTVDYIQKQSADGGGDWPEAVHSALEEAVFNQKWSENAVARIVFLVLDASPHEELEVKISLQKSIRAAAKRGIRIVPIVASGIQKETEWMMKFMDLATNGSYVFLTDHSGIGGKHLEPTTDEYKVELLNQLLVRLISDYSTVENCEGKSSIIFQNDPQNVENKPEKVLFYPNPASLQFTVELPFDLDILTIYNAAGQAVRSLKKLPKGTQIIRVDDLPEGIYTLRILRGNDWQSGKIMVLRS